MLYLMGDLRENLELFFLCSRSIRGAAAILGQRCPSGLLGSPEGPPLSPAQLRQELQPAFQMGKLRPGKVHSQTRLWLG